MNKFDVVKPEIALEMESQGFPKPEPAKGQFWRTAGGYPICFYDTKEELLEINAQGFRYGPIIKSQLVYIYPFGAPEGHLDEDSNKILDGATYMPNFQDILEDLYEITGVAWHSDFNNSLTEFFCKPQSSDEPAYKASTKVEACTEAWFKEKEKSMQLEE